MQKAPRVMAALSHRGTGAGVVALWAHDCEAELVGGKARDGLRDPDRQAVSRVETSREPAVLSLKNKLLEYGI
jgi:hypothetical protein